MDRMIREDQDALIQLLQLGLVVLVSDRRKKAGGWGMSVDPRASLTLFLQGSQGSPTSDVSKMLSSVIIGLGVALLLVIVIMTMALMCVRKRYRSHHPVSPAPPPPPPPSHKGERVNRAWV